MKVTDTDHTAINGYHTKYRMNLNGVIRVIRVIRVNGL